MTDEKFDLIKKDIAVLARVHDLKNFAFCATAEDSKFIGIIDPTSVSHLMAVALNVGRLWQYVRTTISDILDDYDHPAR